MSDQSKVKHSIASWGKRDIYRGENHICVVTLLDSDEQFEVEIINLTSIGITTSANRQIPQDGLDGPISLCFLNRNGKPYIICKGRKQKLSIQRMGQRKSIIIEFIVDLTIHRTLDAFSEALGSNAFFCKTYIRPQVWSPDPFFFHEIIYYQANGFTGKGIDLIVSARCKSLFPNQPVQLNIYIPGRKEFSVVGKVSHHRFFSAKNKIRVYFEYFEPSREFLEEVSEYLVLFSPNSTPARLRQSGFTLGKLDHAFQLSYNTVDNEYVKANNMQPSIFSWPEPITEEFIKNSRGVTCKLGPYLVAACNLLFITEKLGTVGSKLHAHGHRIPVGIGEKSRIEVINFHVTENANLPDYFIPFFKHLIRIAFQSKVKYIFLECTTQILDLLDRLGFSNLMSKVQPEGTSPREFHLMALNIEKVTNAEGSALGSRVWQNVFSEVVDFLGTNANMKTKK